MVKKRMQGDEADDKQKSEEVKEAKKKSKKGKDFVGCCLHVYDERLMVTCVSLAYSASVTSKPFLTSVSAVDGHG